MKEIAHFSIYREMVDPSPHQMPMLPTEWFEKVRHLMGAESWETFFTVNLPLDSGLLAELIGIIRQGRSTKRKLTHGQN